MTDSVFCYTCKPPYLWYHLCRTLLCRISSFMHVMIKAKSGNSQPLPASFIRNSATRGGNMLGLESVTEDSVLLVMDIMVSLA